MERVCESKVIILSPFSCGSTNSIEHSLISLEVLPFLWCSLFWLIPTLQCVVFIWKSKYMYDSENVYMYVCVYVSVYVMCVRRHACCSLWRSVFWLISMLHEYCVYMVAWVLQAFAHTWTYTDINRIFECMHACTHKQKHTDKRTPIHASNPYYAWHSPNTIDKHAHRPHLYELCLSVTLSPCKRFHE